MVAFPTSLSLAPEPRHRFNPCPAMSASAAAANSVALFLSAIWRTLCARYGCSPNQCPAISERSV